MSDLPACKFVPHVNRAQNTQERASDDSLEERASDTLEEREGIRHPRTSYRWL